MLSDPSGLSLLLTMQVVPGDCSWHMGETVTSPFGSGIALSTRPCFGASDASSLNVTSAVAFRHCAFVKCSILKLTFALSSSDMLMIFGTVAINISELD